MKTSNIEILENPHFIGCFISHVGFNTCISIVVGKHLEATLKIIMASVQVVYMYYTVIEYVIWGIIVNVDATVNDKMKKGF